MQLLYNIGIYLYYLIILVVSPFNIKAKNWISGRKNIFKELKTINFPNYKVVWIHCSSLGEFEQGRPIIDRIKKEKSSYKILLTFFSPSGYEIRKNYQNADYVFYLPIDSISNAKNFIDIIKPEIAYFVKYEHWFNYLSQLKKHKIPCYLISANFRDNQLFFKSFGKWYLKLLKLYTLIFVQSNESKELLEKFNINNSIVAGDTRFDRVYENSLISKKFNEIELFRANKKTLLAGSTWAKDEDLLIEFINNNPDNKYIIAPHNVNKETINFIIKKLKLKYCLFSEMQKNDMTECSVLIVNNVGNLSYLYKYSDISYIGGGFNKGIHNILEALTFGNPVIFGSKYNKFKEAKDSIAKGFGFSINNYQEFETRINFLLNSSDYLKIKFFCLDYIKSNIGATELILNSTINKS